MQGISIRPGNVLKPSVSAIKGYAAAQAHVWGFLLGIAICGLLFGGIIAGELSSANTSALSHTVQNLITAIQGHQLALPSDLWRQRLTADFQVIALLWLFGLSVIGLPFVVVVLFIRSFSIGFAVGFTVLDFGWKGFVLATVGIFLYQVLAVSILVVASAIAIRFSADLLQQVYPLSVLSLEFLRYTGAFFLCTVGLVISSGMQAYIMPTILGSILTGGH